MQRDKYFLILIAGFISAIFISSFYKLGFSLFIFFIFISLVLFIYQKFFLLDFNNKNLVLLVVIFIFGFALGIFRYEIKDAPRLDKNLESKIGQKVIVEGVILDEPNKKENSTKIIIGFKNINEKNGNSVIVKDKGIIQTDLYPEFKYGDLVKIEGKLEKPKNLIKDDGREFDYVSYLAKDGINYQINFAKGSLISGGHGNIIKIYLFKIKNSFVDNLNRVISEPQSSFLGGILLGAKSSISKNVSDIFRVAGLSHLVALSGYNITVVAEGITNFLSFLPCSVSFSGGIIGIILFVIMSGASSTAVRAAIMSLIVVLAQVSRRNYQIGRALIIAGLLMIIYNPKILVFDISFQLSFLATVAIIYVSPIVSSSLYFVTDKFKLRETIAGTVSAQLLVLPLILYKMGILSLVALPVNILVLPFIPIIMFFGFICGALGFIGVALSIPFAWVSWLLLTYIIKVSEFFASLPFSSINISKFPVSIMIILYVLIFSLIIYLKKHFPDKE